MRYDVIVVGAGSAGCVLAARLSEDPSREVLLVEAGPDYPTRTQLPLDIADAGRLPSNHAMDHDWAFSSVDGAHRTSPVPLVRGRLVGGSSAVNGAFAMRGFASDYHDWEAAGNPGWGADAVMASFREIETDLDFSDDPWHGDIGPVPVRRYPPEEQSVLAGEFLAAATAAGHPEIVDHNRPNVVGAGPLPVNAVDRLRMSAALTHLEPARPRPNLTVRPNAQVDRLELTGHRATGIRLIGGELVEAGLLVLSAGAYGSPAMLLRSGIGPARSARALGIDPVVDLPGVGRHLVDHPLASFVVPVPAEPARRPHAQNMVTWRSDGDEGPADLHLFAWGPQLTAEPDGDHVAPVLVGLVDPDSTGELHLGSADPTVPPRIDPGWLTDPEGRDLHRLATGFQQMRRILDAPRFRAYVGGASVATAIPDDAELEAVIQRSVRTYHHPVGTCRMGPDPDAGAVVDARGRVHGIEGLVVADASIMPRIPRANTNLPTMMLAERIARDLTRPSEPVGMFKEHTMTFTADTPIDLETVTANQQQTWSQGDFHEISRLNVVMAEACCDAGDLHAGERVLDVACGSGPAALVAARRYCRVTGIDFVPPLLHRARARADAEGLEAEFLEADAQDLPFADDSFDAVVSIYGVQFAPDQERAAREMVRVTRAGGRIVLAGPVPHGWSGDFFSVHARHNPPPPGLDSPLRWGTEDGLRELFGPTAQIVSETRPAFQYWHSTEHAVDVFSQWFGPTIRAAEALDDEGRRTLRTDLQEVFQRYNRATDGTAVVENTYLLSAITVG